MDFITKPMLFVTFLLCFSPSFTKGGFAPICLGLQLPVIGKTVVGFSGHNDMVVYVYVQ